MDFIYPKMRVTPYCGITLIRSETRWGNVVYIINGGWL